MSGLQPLAFYALRVPAGDGLIPAFPLQQAGTISVTMASIDPTEETDPEDADKPKRSTLKIIRLPFDLSDEDEDDEDYKDLMDDEDDSEDSDAELNGGPSDLAKSNKSKKLALLEALAADSDEEMGEDDEDDESSDDEDPKEKEKAMKALKDALSSEKGKGKALEDDDEDSEDLEDDDELSEDEDGPMEEEIVVCTLDTNQHYQQALNITVSKHEMVFFQVTGTHTIHLTGNYVAPADLLADYGMDDDDDDEADYDLSPDEDEVDGLDELIAPGSDSESDELDDIVNPVKGNVFTQKKRKIEEVDDQEEIEAKKPTLAKPFKEEAAKPLLPVAPTVEPVVNGDSKKPSKAEKKKLKKQLKKEEAAPSTSDTVVDGTSKKDTQVNGTANGAEKKVQFKKELVEGPSFSAASNKSDETKKADADTPTTLNIQGMKVEIRLTGEGPKAKKGSKIEMRYIGKLADGKVFDSNKSGKPFEVKLGKGEVIKGWDLGLEGIQRGGTRRLVIPAKLAYGNKALPGIPKGSELTFDVKCVSVS